MTAEEIRAINMEGQAKALETGTVSEHQGALESLKISLLSEIAAQLAELVVEQKVKNAALAESIDLQREELEHRYEHNANMLKVFTQPELGENAAH